MGYRKRSPVLDVWTYSPRQGPRPDDRGCMLLALLLSHVPPVSMEKATHPLNELHAVTAALTLTFPRALRSTVPAFWLAVNWYPAGTVHTAGQAYGWGAGADKGEHDLGGNEAPGR